MRTLFRFFIFLWPGLVLAQTSFQSDLYALHAQVKRTKSYKQQAGARKEIKRNMATLSQLQPQNALEHLSFLVQAIAPLKDHHLGLYEMPDMSLYKTYDPERVPLAMYGGELPAFDPADALQGKYTYGDWFSIAVIPSSRAGEYYGVVVESKVEHWKKGEMAAWFQKREDGILQAIYAHPYTKNYQWYSLERLREGELLRSEMKINGKKMRYVKEKGYAPDFSAVAAETPAFYHDQAGHYTRIKSFQKNTKAVKSTDSLVAILRARPPQDYWIIDIRDHEGGAKSEMKKYWKVVKKYKGKLGFLVNYNTLSQAELFALKARKKAVLMGETTRGMLTYGSNYGKTVSLPSKNLRFYPTDMYGRPGLLRFEGKGISPKVKFSTQEDWISQAHAYLTSRLD